MEIGHSYLLDLDFAPLVHKLMLGKDDNYSNQKDVIHAKLVGFTSYSTKVFTELQ